MKIALDYDKTYTKDKKLWDEFIRLAKLKDHKVYIVTARCPVKDRIANDKLPPGDRWGNEYVQVIYCNGVAKKWCLRNHHEIEIDIWIDDKPEGILNNSTATPEILEKWRESEEYHE